MSHDTTPTPALVAAPILLTEAGLRARVDEAIIDARIATLEATLAQASVVEERTRPGVVGPGSIVTVDDVGSGAGALCQALLGHRVADTVVVALPDGRSRELRIASVAASNR